MCRLTYAFIRSLAELNELYERAVDELYERDLDELYGRDFDELAFGSTNIYARDAEDFITARLVDEIGDLTSTNGKRYAAPHLFARAGSYASSSSSASRGLSHAGSSSPGHSSDGESIFDGSEGSTASAREVGVSKLKTTREKKIRIVGVNGCTGIVFFGQGFLTGGHMDSENLRPETVAAIAEARKNGDVPVVFIGGPSQAVIVAVQGEVRQTFLNA